MPDERPVLRIRGDIDALKDQTLIRLQGTMDELDPGWDDRPAVSPTRVDRRWL